MNMDLTRRSLLKRLLRPVGVRLDSQETVVRQAHHERISRSCQYEPLTLSLSKGDNGGCPDGLPAFRREAGRCPACGERSAGAAVRKILKESFGNKTSEWAAYCGSCKRSLMREELT